jgi:hypothetical protein
MLAAQTHANGLLERRGGIAGAGNECRYQGPMLSDVGEADELSGTVATSEGEGKRR